MSNESSARTPLHFLKRISLCVCLFLLLPATNAIAEFPPSSKVADVVEHAASSFKKIVRDTEKALGRKLLFADAVLQSDIWLLRRELRGSMNKMVKELSSEKIDLLNRVDSKLQELRSQSVTVIATKATDIRKISTAINSSLIPGVRPSPIKIFPRLVKPGYPDGKIRIRVSGNRLNRATLTLRVGQDGVALPPSRKQTNMAEFTVSRADLPRASRRIHYMTATLTIEETPSFWTKVENLVKEDIGKRIEDLFREQPLKRSYSVALTLLPDHIGYARIYAVRVRDSLSDVRGIKGVEGSVSSVSDDGKQQICVQADKGCEIDKPSIKYEITRWNAFYQTEYCDIVCQQPSPYNRPEGKAKGTCPLVKFPGGFRPRQTQNCQANRFEVDRTRWTAKKACVFLVGRPLLRGVQVQATGRIWGKQKCIARHEERFLVTKNPLRIDWTGEKTVDLPANYEGLRVELTTADGKKYTLIHGKKEQQFVGLNQSPKARIAKLLPRRSFWWQ